MRMSLSGDRGLLLRFSICVPLLVLCLGCFPALAEDKPHLSYFSRDYTESRHKFLQSAELAKAHIQSYPHPLKAPDGTAMHTDLAILGPQNAQRLLVVSSGTHGVEGFAGSALQTGLLRDGVANRIPPKVGLVMIHAINPYGFAYVRRMNESNIDLNRSFVDRQYQNLENPGYAELADAIEPGALSWWENLKARATFFWHTLTEGRLALRTAISRGQYTHPKGLFYGGKEPTWSENALRTILEQHFSAATQVTVIDIHTGLGEFGAAEIILNIPPELPAYRFARQCWGKEVKTTCDGGSVSIQPRGTLKLALPEMLPNARVVATSLEFGTLPSDEVFWAMRAENWLHHHARENYPARSEIKTNLLRAFYPDDEQWKDTVWEKGKRIVEQALVCLTR
jgi:hypothetical protein